MSATFPPEPPATAAAVANAAANAAAGANANAAAAATASANTAANAAAKTDWATPRERSNRVALQFIAWVAVTLGRGAARLLLHPIALYYLCFAAAPRRHSARYLARVLGRAATWRERYRHIHRFAATVLDRIYFVRGELQAFELQVHGSALMDALCAQGRGAVLLGAHLGSFEALHAVGSSHPGLRVAMGMFPDNARMIQRVLGAVAPASGLNVIAIGRIGSTLAMREWLDGGGLVGLLGDRFLARDVAHHSARGAASVALPFLGQPVHFTDGPLRLAQLLRRRVVFMVGLYHGGRRYEVRFEDLADFSVPAANAAEREAQLHTALRAYVARLETLVRQAPYNWFNFYDYWGEDAPH